MVGVQLYPLRDKTETDFLGVLSALGEVSYETAKFAGHRNIPAGEMADILKQKAMNPKFGMFIHWGFYSLYGEQEQVLARLDLDSAEYEKRMVDFNPAGYNPEEWVLLAKNAGMSYICFTAKHHDGFCMWDTKHTNYNIMNTSYGGDTLKMLSAACEKHGIKLSLYYSNPDWHYEYGYNPNSSHQWKAKNKDHPKVPEYIEYIKNQITELLSNYGKIYTLFWDIPPGIEDESINGLARELQPGILINDRGFGKGDFATPEREVPEGNRFERMTEACQSVGEQSWGWRANEDYFSLRFLMSSIDKIMAMGGSYLLNVGPKPDGKIDETSSETVKKVGIWFNKVSEAFRDVEADGYDYRVNAELPFIAVKNANKTYLHFYDGIISSGVTLLTYPQEPAKVRLLNTGEALPFELARLPALFNEHGYANGPYLHIQKIPVDRLVHEPIVLEITW
ncbi:MAG: alpha-L-fucosidase [Oscillospiraceae bacterium]|jgi:alpha-L-fucosidase|nr:alpha-L-fucosidase [Oscillospiraceae bacterium]